MRLNGLCFLLLLFSFFSSRSQQFLETHINVGSDGKVDKQGAIIYLPAHYSRSKSYPLVVFTHGMGEAGTNIKKLYRQGLPKVLKQGYRPPFDFIMVAVQRGYFSVKPEWLPGILKDCQKRWKIDNDRIYLTGISAGGWTAYGSQLNISKAFAKKFAALVINSGVTNNIDKEKLDWWKQTKTPLWAIVGAADKSYVTRNRNMVKEINKRVGGIATLTVRPGVGHGGWSDVYKGKVKLDGKNIYEWMYQFKRSGSGSSDPSPPGDDADENNDKDAKSIKINIYSGSNPYSNRSWYNWNVGKDNKKNIKTKTLDYSNGTASSIRAELSRSDRVADNGASYGAGIAPAGVLRYTSYTQKDRTLTLTGLSSSKRYTIELFGSRKKNPGLVTIYKINTTTRKISTYNNLEDRAVFKDIKPDNNKRIVVKIESANTYNYLNGFTIIETKNEDD